MCNDFTKHKESKMGQFGKTWLVNIALETSQKLVFVEHHWKILQNFGFIQEKFYFGFINLYNSTHIAVPVAGGSGLNFF